MVPKCQALPCSARLLDDLQAHTLNTCNVFVEWTAITSAEGGNICTKARFKAPSGVARIRWEPPALAEPARVRYEQCKDGRIAAYGGSGKSPGRDRPLVVASAMRLQVLRHYHLPSQEAAADAVALNAASAAFVEGAAALLEPTTMRPMWLPVQLVSWMVDTYGLEQQVLTSAATICRQGVFSSPPRLSAEMVQPAHVPLGFDLATDRVTYDFGTPWGRSSYGCVNQNDGSFKWAWKKATATAAAGRRVIMVVALDGEEGLDSNMGAASEGVKARRILHFPRSTLPCGPEVYCRHETKKGAVLVPELAWAVKAARGGRTVVGPAERPGGADHRLTAVPNSEAVAVFLLARADD